VCLFRKSNTVYFNTVINANKGLRVKKIKIKINKIPCHQQGEGGEKVGRESAN
jgi:hypothetical protein